MFVYCHNTQVGQKNGLSFVISTEDFMTFKTLQVCFNKLIPACSLLLKRMKTKRSGNLHAIFKYWGQRIIGFNLNSIVLGSNNILQMLLLSCPEGILFFFSQRKDS